VERQPFRIEVAHRTPLTALKHLTSPSAVGEHSVAGRKRLRRGRNTSDLHPRRMAGPVPTHCPYCALQCGMSLRLDGPKVVVDARDFPTNRGGLCQKGWTSSDLLSSPERLTTPLARESRGEPLRPVSWNEALDRIATQFRRTQEAHGADGVAVFGGGGLTNEKAYLLGKFARVALGTSNIDYNGRFCMSSAAAAGIRAFGIDRGLPFPLSDLSGADTILLMGGNPAETMPPFTRWLADQRSNGGSLIVVDPRLTPTARQATLHLQITPGTDLALANGLLHIAIAGGHVDEDYVRTRTTGFDEVRQVAAAYWPERVERITGVSVAEQRAAADLLVRAGTAMVLTARGAEQHSKGVDTVSALINLALALGLPGRANSGYGCLTGQGNGQGAASTVRRLTSCPDTAASTTRQRAHMSPRCGASTPIAFPDPAGRRSSCSIRSGNKTDRTPCSSWQATSRCRPLRADDLSM
jgi:assimilatory nitrate reductase catalytic subunit